MSGLGAFIQGAFQGYSFGEDVKDRKTKRERDKENHEWTKQTRDWAREDRDYQLERREVDDAWTDESRDYTRGQRARARRSADASWSRAAKERSVLAAAGQHAIDTYDKPQPLAPKVADPSAAPKTSQERSVILPGDADSLQGGQGSDTILPDLGDRLPSFEQLSEMGAPDDILRLSEGYESIRKDRLSGGKNPKYNDWRNDQMDVNRGYIQEWVDNQPKRPAAAPPGRTERGKQANPGAYAWNPGNPAKDDYEPWNGRGDPSVSYDAGRGTPPFMPIERGAPRGPLRAPVSQIAAAPPAPAGPTQRMPSMPEGPAPKPYVDEAPTRERANIPTAQDLAAMNAPLQVMTAAKEYHFRQDGMADQTDPRRLQRWQQENLIAAQTVTDWLSKNRSAAPAQPPAPITAGIPASGLPPQGAGPAAPPMPSYPTVGPGAGSPVPGPTASPQSPPRAQPEPPASSPVAAPMRTGLEGPESGPAPQQDDPAGYASGPITRPDIPTRPDPSTLLSAPDHMPKAGTQLATLPGAQVAASSVAPDQGGAPAIKIAEATAPRTQQRGVLGKDDPVKATAEETERAATNFLDHYAQTAVPQIIQYYASTGQIEKAEAYETWARSRESQGLQRSWAKATHAAAIGDDDAFLTHMKDLYNGVSDGYEVQDEGTEFIKDKQGNIVGAQMSLKNLQTGETFTRQFDGQQDLLEMGIYTFSPEQIFEHMWGQMEAARAIDAENREFQQKIALERIKKGYGSEQDLISTVEDAKKFLSETMLYGEWDQLTPEEQNQKALDYIRSNQDAAATLRRGALPPEYTGQ